MGVTAMAEILVLGAGLNGLTTALLLARDGHRVTVLERDAAAAPNEGGAELWDGWERPGVGQFRQLHLMLPRWRAVLERELPEVIAELEARGGLRIDLVGMMPAELTGGRQDGDERFETVTARRPVLESAVAAVATRTEGVTIQRGVAVTGLLTDTSSNADIPHVTGVTAAGGRTIRADLVIDAMGRRSPLLGMLDAVGARRPVEEREESGFVYYARHFRTRDGSMPAAMAAALQHFEGVSALSLPCDNGTWGVGFVTSSRDKRLHALRETAAWERALALFPTVAHWGAGLPITGVQAFGGLEDRYRRFVVDDTPVATGLVAVGDSWACTNPSLGRGATIGLLHSCALRDLLRVVGPDEREKFAIRFDEVTETVVAPLYRMTVGFDRHRLAEIDGDIAGRPYQTDDRRWAMAKALDAAALDDPTALRARSSIMSLIATPDEALADPDLRDTVLARGAGAPRYPAPAPGRAELLAAIDGDGHVL
jgi:2-polyprenyl-6-methoxyphenol hydroxylase-like FAD-dependent oxidoreductase